MLGRVPDGFPGEANAAVQCPTCFSMSVVRASGNHFLRVMLARPGAGQLSVCYFGYLGMHKSIRIGFRV